MYIVHALKDVKLYNIKTNIKHTISCRIVRSIYTYVGKIDSVKKSSLQQVFLNSFITTGKLARRCSRISEDFQPFGTPTLGCNSNRKMLVLIKFQ